MTKTEIETLEQNRKILGIVKPSDYFLEQQFIKVVRVFIKSNVTFLKDQEKDHYKQLLLEDKDSAVDYADSIGLVPVIALPDFLRHNLHDVNFELFKDVFERAFNVSERYFLIEVSEALVNRLSMMVKSSELFVSK
jgi:hypothetical protein